MNRPARAFVVGLTLSVLTSACFAALLTSRGQPEQVILKMTTYGVGASTRVGLKSVLPPGWQLLVHRSVSLPETMSWKLDDSWMTVLSEFATKTNIAVLVDWDTRTVLLRTPELALEEGAKKEEITQAAITPLPKFTDAITRTKAKERDAKVTAAAEILALKQQEEKTQLDARQAREFAEQREARTRGDQAAAASLASVPVIRTNPTPLMVATQLAAAKNKPQTLGSSTDFRYTKPVTLNKPSARTVAQAIANRFNLRLVWAAAELRLRGPVTLLADSPEQDAQLLQKALGVFSPVAVEVSLHEKVLRVVPRELAGRPLAAEQLAATLASPAMGSPADSSAGSGSLLDEIERPTAVDTASNAALATSGKPAPVVVPRVLTRAPKLVFNIADKEPLEDALVRFSRSQGFTLEWKVAGGFEANRAMHFEGSSLAELLSQLLPKMGLSADIYTHEKHIVVRPGDVAQDR